MVVNFDSINGENKHYGTPTNPCAPDRVPGGSSSGSAVAVSAGLVDFALGELFRPLWFFYFILLFYTFIYSSFTGTNSSLLQEPTPGEV